MTFLVDSRVSGSPLSVLFYYRRENSSVFAGGEVSGQVSLALVDRRVGASNLFSSLLLA